MGTRGARAAKADGGKPAQSATTTPGGKHVRGATPPAPARRKKPCLDLVSLVVSLWYFAVVAITTAVLMYASRNGIAYDAYFAMVVARMPLLVGTLWLVFRRMRTARLAIVVVSAVGLAMTLADGARVPTPSPSPSGSSHSRSRSRCTTSRRPGPGASSPSRSTSRPWPARTSPPGASSSSGTLHGPAADGYLGAGCAR